jgi:hypothetical protein
MLVVKGAVMHRLFAVIAALVATSASAAITSTTCTSSDQSGCVTLPLYLYASAQSVSVQVSGTWVGQLEFEGSNDGSTYYRLKAYPVPNGAFVSSTSNNGAWLVDAAGLNWFRVRASVFSSGAASVSPQPSSAVPVGNVEVASVPEPVAIFGSVNSTLTPDTIAALGPAPCTHGETRRVQLSTTAQPIPADLPDGGPGAISGRTEILLVNADTVQRAACRLDPGDGGVPDCATPGYGLTLFPNGGSTTFSARDSVRIRCRSCTANAALEYQEASCAR